MVNTSNAPAVASASACAVVRVTALVSPSSVVYPPGGDDLLGDLGTQGAHPGQAQPDGRLVAGAGFQIGLSP